ncbi:carboxypeptidase-like regulatory domain-containing protein [Flavobacterium sp.]|uniref:carboxypeptidase-like regulatory domain-containing protein n=1 Tax=Flavobacterium sp. TaxID=239 RepID=UPI003750CBBC
MKKLVFSILFVLQAVLVFAQSGTGFSGKVLDSKTQKPIQNVVATIQNSNLTEITDVNGKFVFKSVTVGTQLLLIKNVGYKDQLISVDVENGKILELGVIVLEEDITQEQQLSLITITENDLGDDNSGSESTAGLLQASRDVFQQAAAFNWGQARFRIRGLDNESSTTMINGVTMNKLYDGRPQWSNWGGLNDATRNQEFTSGSAPSDYTFGGILGTQEINTRASIYRPGSRISFSGTNTNYSWRTMGTHASGMNKNGWAFVVSASRRWAQEGYFEGTNYSANSLFASVEKKINENHSLNFTSIYAENSRAKNSPNTQETTDIAGEKYNSYWGYQDGKKRNSRVKDLVEPILILNHYWKINDKTRLNSSISHQYGTIGNSRLDYQGTPNPDPTYYRNMPSYFTSLYDTNGVLAPDYVGAQSAAFLTNRQIDWNNLYNANTQSVDKRSYYTLYEDRTDDKTWIANTILSTQLADNIVFNGGATYNRLKSHNFQNLLDLLGGSYFLDYDNYGTTPDQTQADLNNPNRVIKVGDTYGYNYNLTANKITAFTQFKFTYKKVDFYLSQSYDRAEYQREGLYKNGYYPTNSFGKSEKAKYENFGFKGGITYKITGRQFINLNGVYMTKAPTLRNVFGNVRINNNITLDVQNENINSLDASYIIKNPTFKARLTGFFTQTKHATETSFFFADGVSIDDGNPDTVDVTSAFVAETVSNISKRNIGVELGLEYQISCTIKATFAANYGEYIYDNNPTVRLNVDARATAADTYPVADYGEATLKNYKLAGMPQSAAALGLEYRDPKFWWIGANVNYLANSYIDVAPITRTKVFFYDPAIGNGVPLIDANDERARELLKQEKFNDFTLVNLTGGKSWKIKSYTFGLFASVNNVFDVVYKTGGFEQARNSSYLQLNQDVSSGTPAFAPKYFYGYGRTYFLNLYINF